MNEIGSSNPLKQAGWLRGLEVLTGVSALIFGGLVFVGRSFGVATLVLLLSVGLIFAGIRSISIIGLRNLPIGLRAQGIIAGAISLVFAFLALLIPGYGVLTLMFFVAFGLIAYGLSRMLIAYSAKMAVGWIRGMLVITGMFDVILSVLVFVFSGLALLTLAIVLSIVLLTSGVEMIISGAIGRTWLIAKIAVEEVGPE